MELNKTLLLNHLQAYKKIKTDVEFARFLGITPQLLSRWKAKNIYNLGKLIIAFPEVEPNWLVTGMGPMLKSEAQTKAPQNADITRSSSGNVVTISSEAWEVIRNQAATIRLMYERIARLEQIMPENDLQTSDLGVSQFPEGKNPPPYKIEETK